MKFLKRLFCPHEEEKKILFFDSKLDYYGDYRIDKYVFTECKQCGKVKVNSLEASICFSSRVNAENFCKKLTETGFVTKEKYEAQRFLE